MGLLKLKKEERKREKNRKKERRNLKEEFIQNLWDTVAV